MSTMLNYALNSAARGIPVFPAWHPQSDGSCACDDPECSNPGKHPRISGWQEKATTDEATILDWWRRWPRANVAYPTGARSGTFVLDIDPRHGGDYDQLSEVCGEIPPTLTVLTGGGGLQLVFQHPGFRVPNDALGKVIGPGYDIRGDGGLAIAPGSLHYKGKRYAWLDEAMKPTPAPQWLLDRIQAASATPMPEPSNPLPPTGDRHERARHWLDHYMPAASPRNRNDTGKLLCLQLRDDARLDQGEAEGYMRDYAAAVGLPEREVVATVHSISKREPRRPAHSQKAPATMSSHIAPAVEEADDDDIGFFLSGVKSKPIEWLWKNYIPLGKVTIVDGDGGFGKTLILGDIAARITRGWSMPDGSRGVAGGVVILNAEDGVEDTLRPRLEAADADMDRVLILETAVLRNEKGERKELPISIPRDIPTIEKAIKRADAMVVIVDPVMSFLDGGVDSHKDQDARTVTRPLAALAERAGIALVLVRHISKGGSSNPQHRGIASVAWINSARSGLVVGPDPDDAEKRVLALNKTNIAPRSTPSLSYKIVGEDQATLRVEWLGTSQHDAKAVLGQYGASEEDKDARYSLDDAKDFLRAELVEDARASDIIGRAKDIGISKRTLDRARADLNVKAQKKGFGGNTHWVWTKIANDANEDCHPQDNGNLRTDTGGNGASVADLAEDCQSLEGGNLHNVNSNLRADAHEHPPADVAPAAIAKRLRHHCDRCGVERGFDDGKRCNLCDWEIGTPVTVDAADTDDGNWGDVA